MALAGGDASHGKRPSRPLRCTRRAAAGCSNLGWKRSFTTTVPMRALLLWFAPKAHFTWVPCIYHAVFSICGFIPRPWTCSFFLVLLLKPTFGATAWCDKSHCKRDQRRSLWSHRSIRWSEQAHTHLFHRVASVWCFALLLKVNSKTNLRSPT